MLEKNELMPPIRPFIKWAGGKRQLLDEIRKYYPFNDNTIYKYAEPFVGGGAVLFDILNNYNITEIYINDINKELINTYITLRDNSEDLISKLSTMQATFHPMNQEERSIYYYEKRALFNELKLSHDDNLVIERAALFIFLNKTCFNGLFRVNSKGQFNVPIGKYKLPIICDEDNLREISNRLQNVTITHGDYRQSREFIDEHTFVYFDPPYRPLTPSSSFTSYTETGFDDASQIELANYFIELHHNGAKILLSNSDPKNTDETDDFFDRIFNKFNIERISATRMINSKASRRGSINEILVSNFTVI